LHNLTKISSVQTLLSTICVPVIVRCRLWRPSDLIQKYLDTTNFHYIFHIKLLFFSRYYHEVNSCPILIIVLSTKAELYVVYSSYFEITFHLVHENYCMHKNLTSKKTTSPKGIRLDRKVFWIIYYKVFVVNHKFNISLP
jgi:hypothetical protein